MIFRHDSLTEYMASIKNLRDWGGGDRKWAAGIGPEEAVKRATIGDEAGVARFEAEIDAMGAEAVERLRYVSGIAGTSVNVPAYLAGNPACMRRRAKQEASNRHVSVYVSVACSAGISADTMIKRGAVVLGLLAALQSLNVSVDLHLVCDMQGYEDGTATQVVRIESRPLDLSVSGFVIAHPAFSRHVMYSKGAEHHTLGGKPSYLAWSKLWNTHCYGDVASSAYCEAIRASLGCQPSDIFVPPVHLRDEIVTDPQAWMRARLHQALSTRTEDEAAQ